MEFIVAILCHTLQWVGCELGNATTVRLRLIYTLWQFFRLFALFCFCWVTWWRVAMMALVVNNCRNSDFCLYLFSAENFTKIFCASLIAHSFFVVGNVLIWHLITTRLWTMLWMIFLRFKFIVVVNSIEWNEIESLKSGNQRKYRAWVWIDWLAV